VVDELPRLPNGKVDRQGVASLASERRTPSRSTSSPTVLPSTADDRVTEAIRAVWEEVLGGHPVELDDDFNAIGGDSLLAAQMLVTVEQRLGVIVPMGELIHARTVRQLASVVAGLDVGRTAATSVACVQRGSDSRPRLWFVPDLQGSAFRVRHLARHLGADQPVFSFESPLLAGEPNRFTSLDTFAAHLVADLVDAQPEGPYWLAGYSFGGICAYEMARQMRNDGLDVTFLGVVDVGPAYRGPAWDDRRSPFRPWFGVRPSPPEGSTVAESARYYRDMWAESPSNTLRHLMVRSGVARVVDPLRFASDLRRHGRVRPEWRLWYSWEEHWKLAAKFWDRDRPYGGRVDLFWASQTGSTDNSMGWSALVGDLHIHRFPGFHDHLLEEADSPALAASLRAELDRRVG
jgi:thioesterase domain-containing protein/acyl carrier protein